MILGLTLRFGLAAALTAGTMAGIGYGLAATLLPAPARYYHTSYMRMAIPEGWNCGIEGTEHICGPINTPGAKSNTIMVLTAKERGPGDTLDHYRAYLGALHQSADDDGGTVILNELRDQQIGGQVWVVAVTEGSLLRDYRSYYYATVVGNLAALVTMSTHNSVADAHDADALRLLESLKLHKPPGGAGGIAVLAPESATP